MASSSSSSSHHFHHQIPRFPPMDASHFMEAKIMVWWDSSTAPFPSNIDPLALIENIQNALTNAGYHGSKMVFWGKGSCHDFPSELSQKLQMAIVRGFPRIVRPSRFCAEASSIPDFHGRVSAAILMDMFKSERRFTYPVNHLLISGHELFKRPLCVLKERGHNILISRPSTASNVFDYNIATTVWDWNDLAQGKPPLFTLPTFIPNREAGSNVGHLAPGSSSNEAEEDDDFSLDNIQLDQLNLF